MGTMKQTKTSDVEHSDHRAATVTTNSDIMGDTQWLARRKRTSCVKLTRCANPSTAVTLGADSCR